MTMEKENRTAGALTLAAITVLSAAGLSSVYGALGVDTEQKCSLTFTLDGTEFAELNEVEIPVDVYQIADITEEAQYTAHTGYEGLGLDQISRHNHRRSVDADGRRCMKIVEDTKAEPTAVTTVEKKAGESTATGKIENLKTGMYLVAAETVQTSEYTYDFSPYLVSLPNNYYSGEHPDDTWVYDVTTGMKPQQTQRYGDLEIVKDLTAYNTSLQEALFVFQVEGTRNGENVYSDVVTIKLMRQERKQHW